MSWVRVLVLMVVYGVGLQGAVIGSGSISESQLFLNFGWSSSGTLLLSDGATLKATHGEDDGSIADSCTDYGSGCKVSGYTVAVIGDQGPGAFLFATYDVKSFSVVPTLTVQTFQTAFTVTGSAYVSYSGPTTDPCIFPEVTTPGYTCAVPATGSGIATITVTRLPYAGALGQFFVSSTDFTFTTPEPATPILLTAGLGLLFFIRKRRTA